MSRSAAGSPGEIVVASSNPGKLREFRAILSDRSFRLLGLGDFPPLALPEEGDDYAANARAKARHAADGLGRWALADDSGLEVEALGGRPGPYSARYGGPGLDDAGRCQRLLAELEGVEDGRRGARFVCVAALAAPGGELWSARGELEGRVLRAPRGRGGFGYDPIFQLADGRALAELSEAEKNQLSHRARAVAALLTRAALGESGRGRPAG